MGLAHSPQELGAAQLREHQIEHEQIVGIGADIAFTFAATARQIDGETFGTQSASDEISKLAIVLDYQYSHSCLLCGSISYVSIRAALDQH